LKKIILFFTITLLLINLGNQSFAESEKLAILDTNMGKITIEFFPNDAPNHVKNFIGLTTSGFYDGTLFHRIIPGFMIQGGDPNTINDDQNSWGQGGPNERINAEFNTIKHNRGIVSMARSQDPNSAGSQFFIVHKDSNFLDGQYTVFGRIVTEESFETLDKIAAVQTGVSDRPIDSKNVKITNVKIVNYSEIPNLLELKEPERTESIDISSSIGDQIYQSEEYEVKFSVPEGWLLQQPEKTTKETPNIIAVGPKIGNTNPVISLTIKDTNEKTFDYIINKKNNKLRQAIQAGSLEIISQNYISVSDNKALETLAYGYFLKGDEKYDIQFKDILIYGTEKIYTFTYTNDVVFFDVHLPEFEKSLNSFEILSISNIIDEPISNIIEESESQDNGGGCLIATATYGSEMATEVQQLREIRDNQLLNTKAGKSFINSFNDVYYSFSPIIADYERENPVFQEMVKLAITPMISSLSIMSYAESDSEVISLGIGIILLNLGMYLGVPVAIVIGIKKVRRVKF